MPKGKGKKARSSSGKKKVSAGTRKKAAGKKKGPKAAPSSVKTGSARGDSPGTGPKKKASKRAAKKTVDTEVLTASEKTSAVGVSSEDVRPETVSAETDGVSQVLGSSAGSREIELVTFELIGRRYAIRVEDVEEILRNQNITYVPRTKKFVLGVTTVRGRIVPIIDLAGLIKPGSSVEWSEKGKVLLIRGHNGSVGVQLGRSLNIISVPRGAIQPNPSGVPGEESVLTEGVVRVGDNFVSVFDTGKVLSIQAAGEVNEREA